MADETRTEGRPLAVDRDATSHESSLPAFFARPGDAPVYHGFPVIEGLDVNGFRLGMITDFLSEPDTVGDAFVIAPDGSRAGLVWEAETEPYFHAVVQPSAARWGVWAVGLPLPLTTVGEARVYLETLLPELQPRWEAWVSAHS